MRNRGFEPGTQVLFAGLIPAPPDIAGKLQTEPGEELARLLSIRPKSALLYIERVSYTERNTPLEFLRIYYRADRYSLYNELQG